MLNRFFEKLTEIIDFKVLISVVIAEILVTIYKDNKDEIPKVLETLKRKLTEKTH